MRDTTINGVKFTFPNPICFSRSPFCYAKIDASGYTDGDIVGIKKVMLKVTCNGAEVILNRFMNPLVSKSVIFPLVGVVESLIGEDYTQPPVFSIYAEIAPDADTEIGTGDNSVILSGYNDTEIALEPASNYPASKVVIYPKVIPMYDIFVPVNVKYKAYYGGKTLISGSGKPFLRVYTQFNVHWSGVNEIVIKDESGNQLMVIPIDVDDCTDGVFVKWIDMHGIPCVYRFTQEQVVESTDDDSVYYTLNKTLAPTPHQERTIYKTYTLHSRLVPQDIYDLCKSILSGRDIQFLNTANNTWKYATVESGETADGGETLKDFVFELTEKIFNV